MPRLHGNRQGRLGTVMLLVCALFLLAWVSAGRAEEPLPASAECVSEGAVSEQNGHSVTFQFNEGVPQDVLIPLGVEEITIDAEGGHGGSGNGAGGGGAGGGVQATVKVQPGRCLQVWVGGYGGHLGGDGYAHGGRGADKATSGGHDGGGGGGASAVANLSGTDTILVAGGGGGGGGNGGGSGISGGGGGA